MLSEIDVAKELLKINAIRLQPNDPFTWASGMRSPIYCDNRMSLSFPDLRTNLKETMATKAGEAWTYNKVAGVATAGIPMGTLIADVQGLPFIYVRSSAKGHGARNQIEGKYIEGDVCLVVEDLISTGGSSIAAVEVLRQEGIEVVGVVAIFTYELDVARENFEKANCPLITISNYTALLQAAKEMNALDQHQISSLQEWCKNPHKWSDENC